jgi:hypothetical protein
MPAAEPAVRPATSTSSTVACTVFRLLDMADRASSRSSATWAMPTLVSVVENGCEATAADPPVRALKSEDLPALGRPTMPMRSTGRRL